MTALHLRIRALLHKSVLLCAGAMAVQSAACAAAPAAPPVDAARGSRLISQYQCGACHVIPRIASARGRDGPSLQGFGRRSYIAGRLPNTADTLARWIESPAALVPSTTMPDMGVTERDARDMAAWLMQQRD